MLQPPVARHGLFLVLCVMEDLMVQLETAQQERVKTLKEFMRLKNELALAQRRCDELNGSVEGTK